MALMTRGEVAGPFAVDETARHGVPIAHGGSMGVCLPRGNEDAFFFRRRTDFRSGEYSGWSQRDNQCRAIRSQPVGFSRYARERMGMVRGLVRGLPYRRSALSCRSSGRLRPRPTRWFLVLHGEQHPFRDSVQGRARLQFQPPGLPPQSPTTSKQVGGVRTPGAAEQSGACPGSD